MYIITLNSTMNVTFRKSSGGCTVTFEANRPYLIANAQFDRISRDPNVQNRLHKVSRVESRIQNFNVKALPQGSKVLLYNGSGGFGDQIMTWPVAKELSKKFQVHILTEPGNNVCWWNFPFIRSVQNIPMAYDMVNLFDGFAHLETVSNVDEHQDQEHHVDLMLRHFGYSQAEIDAADKVVRPAFTFDELGSLTAHTQIGRPIGLYQLSSANPVRCLPAADSAHIAIKLAEAYPDMTWLCLFDEFIPEAYRKCLDEKIKEKQLTNITPFCAANLRELWALTEYASVVVAPDSMMVHIAGSLDTPCVGLWGPVDPDRRVRYYKSHRPVYHKTACPHSPCFVYTATYPRCCPPIPGQRKCCDVLASVSAEDVVEAVRAIKR